MRGEHPVILRAVTYNLHGGTRPEDRDREDQDLGELAELKPDVLAVQEAKYWDRDHYRRLHAAEHILGMRGFLAESNNDGCHLVTFVRQPQVRVLEQRHRHHPFHHAANRLRALVHGRVLDLVNVHLAPASPTQRLIEAETLKLMLPGDGDTYDVLACGDWNAAADGAGQVPLTGVPAGHLRRKRDTRAADALAEDYHDVGAYLGDLGPTVGHAGPDTLAVRIDRFHTTLHPATFVGYQVLPIGASDHRPVLAEFQLNAEPRP